MGVLLELLIKLMSLTVIMIFLIGLFIYYVNFGSIYSGICIR